MEINEKREIPINSLLALQVVFVDKMVRLLGTLLSILVQHVFLFIKFFERSQLFLFSP